MIKQEISHKVKKPIIDPWGSATFENYEKLFKEFGVKKISETMRKELKHFTFERNIILGHRDFDKVFERIKNKQPFINMTGIATSGELHFGHKLIVDIFKFLKECGGKSYFAVCDIDAYTSRPDSKIATLKKSKEFAVENLSHVLALGLTERDVYIQSKKEPRYYEFTFELSKKITESTFRAIYGHLDLGKVSANLLQYADILHPQLPEYEGKMPSVTAIAFEQDPHLRAVRDLAQRLQSVGYDFELPSALFAQHLSGLKEGVKMSKSVEGSAIFLEDKPEIAAKKIMNAVDGGRKTAEEQRRLGGHPDICKVYEFMKFNYKDTKDLKKMYEDCISGRLLCGECKKIRAEYVKKFMEQHHEKLGKTKELAKQIVFG